MAHLPAFLTNHFAQLDLKRAKKNNLKPCAAGCGVNIIAQGGKKYCSACSADNLQRMGNERKKRKRLEK